MTLMKIRFEKKNRYYTLRLYCDLMGQWVVERLYGSKQTRQCRVKYDVCISRGAARQQFIKLARYRLEQRHYRRITDV